MARNQQDTVAMRLYAELPPQIIFTGIGQRIEFSA